MWPKFSYFGKSEQIVLYVWMYVILTKERSNMWMSSDTVWELGGHNLLLKLFSHQLSYANTNMKAGG